MVVVNSGGAQRRFFVCGFIFPWPAGCCRHWLQTPVTETVSLFAELKRRSSSFVALGSALQLKQDDDEATAAAMVSKGPQPQGAPSVYQGFLSLVVAENQAGYFGVKLNKPGRPKPFEAKVRRAGKRVHLGSFATAEEAAMAIARTPEGHAAARKVAARRACSTPLTSEEARQQARAEGLTRGLLRGTPQQARPTEALSGAGEARAKAAAPGHLRYRRGGGAVRRALAGGASGGQGYSATATDARGGAAAGAGGGADADRGQEHGGLPRRNLPKHRPLQTLAAAAAGGGVGAAAGALLGVECAGQQGRQAGVFAGGARGAGAGAGRGAWAGGGGGAAAAIGGGADGDEDARAACVREGALRRGVIEFGGGRGAAADEGARGEGRVGSASTESARAEDGGITREYI